MWSPCSAVDVELQFHSIVDSQRARIRNGISIESVNGNKACQNALFAGIVEECTNIISVKKLTERDAVVKADLDVVEVFVIVCSCNDDHMYFPFVL